MQKNAELVLIPWYHRDIVQAHREVVEYIKKLPKNSTLLLEVSPPDLMLVDKFYGMVARGKESYYTERYSKEFQKPQTMQPLEEEIAYLNRLSKQPVYSTHLEPRVARANAHCTFAWELLEVVRACEARNIKIVPLGTPYGLFTHAYKAGNCLDGAMKSMTYREKQAIENIKRALKDFKGDELPVLYGLAHTNFLKKMAKKAGMRVRIEEDFFTQKRLIRTLRREAERDRLKYRRGDKSIDKHLRTPSAKKLNLMGYKEMQKYYGEREGLLKKSWKTKEERWNRKLKERKKALAKRKPT